MEKFAVPDKPMGTKPKASFSTIYKPSVVEKFWEGTSEDLKRTVKTTAEVRPNEILSEKVLKRLSNEEKAYLKGSSADDLERLLHTYLGGATQRRDAVKTSGRKRDRTERKTTDLMNSFHGYVEAYSGVIQIMNGVPGAAGYGDAAYGALSALLMVAVNKVKTEELIDDTMRTLHQEYCRIKIVNEIHPTDRMKEHTAVVYRLGVEFLHTAIRYYSVGTFRRLWYGISRPPSIELDHKTLEIRAAVEEVRKEMEILDSKRLKAIETKLDNQGMTIIEQAAKIDRTEKDVQALRTEVDQERLKHLQELLGVDLNEIDPPLEKYDELLTDTFDMRNPALFDVHEHLYMDNSFLKWREPNELDLIILQGVTDYPHQTDLSWLSPSATHVVRNIDKVFQNNAPLLLRHFCQTKYNCGGRKVAGSRIVKSLIFQLLRNCLSEPLLRDNRKYAEVKHEIELVNELDAGSSTEVLKKLFGILRNLLKKIEITRLLIVIDRLDAMEGDLEAFIVPLVKLITNDHCKVKVMLTLCHPCSLESAWMKRGLGELGYKILELDQGD